MTLEQMKEAHQKIIAPIASQSSGPRPGMPGYIPPKPSAPASAAFGIVPSAGHGGKKRTLKKRKSMKRKSMKQKHRK